MLALEAFAKRAEKLLQLLAELGRRLQLRLANAVHHSHPSPTDAARPGLDQSTHLLLPPILAEHTMCGFEHQQGISPQPLSAGSMQHVLSAASATLADGLKDSLSRQRDENIILPATLKTAQNAVLDADIRQCQACDIIAAIAGEEGVIALVVVRLCVCGLKQTGFDRKGQNSVAWHMLCPAGFQLFDCWCRQHSRGDTTCPCNGSCLCTPS